jgi:hypothetical protein
MRTASAASEATTSAVFAEKKKQKVVGKHIQPSAKKLKQRDAAVKLQDQFAGLKQAIESSKQPDAGFEKVWIPYAVVQLARMDSRHYLEIL